MKKDIVDWSQYNEKANDEKKITVQDKWVPCRICEDVYRRVRLTARYCNKCKKAFCEGEHGTFSSRVAGECLICHYKKFENK